MDANNELLHAITFSSRLSPKVTSQNILNITLILYSSSGKVITIITKNIIIITMLIYKYISKGEKYGGFGGVRQYLVRLYAFFFQLGWGVKSFCKLLN